MARAKYSPERIAALCDALRRIGNIGKAADACGIDRDTAYHWRNMSRAHPEDPRWQVVDPLGEEEPEPLHLVWERCIDIAMDDLENALYQMGKGILEPVIFQGQQMYEVDPLGKPVIEEYTEADPITGEAKVKYRVRPCYKLDPITGDAIPLMVLKSYERAAEILLKAHRAEKFRERVDVKHSGKVAVAPLMAPAKVATSAEFERLFGGKQEG